jgi:hypothetical protein
VKSNGRVFVKPSLEAMEERITWWRPSLIGQFLDQPPFFYVKKAIKAMWSKYGKKSMENNMFLSFYFNGEQTQYDVIDAKMWFINNKPHVEKTAT